MKLPFKTVIIGLSAICLLSLIGCLKTSSVDYSIVTEELLDLRAEVLEGKLTTEPWGLAIRVGKLSEGTRLVMAQYAAKEEMPPVDLKLTSYLREIEDKVNIKRNGFYLLNPAQPPGYMLKWPESLQARIDSQYDEILGSDEVWAYEFVDQDYREEHFCRNQCVCYAVQFKKLITESFPEVRAYIISIYGGSDTIGVKIRQNASKGLDERSYSYHTGLLLVGAGGSVGVVDPIMYQDSKIRSLNKWYDNLWKASDFQIKIVY